MTADEIWQAALGELQLEMTRATFETWVKPTSLVSYQAGEMVIATPNQYAQEWLAKRLCSTVNRVLTGITGRSMQATFVVWKAPVEESASESEAIEPVHKDLVPDWSRRGIPDRFINKTLDDLDWSRPVLQQTELRDYADRYAEFLNAGIGLQLYGPNGIGKTHLVIGLAKKACQELGWTIEFITWRGYLADLRQGYAEAQQRYGEVEPEYRVLQRLVEVDLLVLDDLRADDLTPWARGKLLDLIARRYDAERPVLVTTNYDLNELTYPGVNRLGHDEAAISRLLGMCQYIALQGEDYRLLERRVRVSGLPTVAGERKRG
jgi:DNA replication protein DnaC